MSTATKSSICNGCGHEQRHHCDPPRPHIPEDDDARGWHSCILAHCNYGIRLDETGVHLCPCPAFEFDGKITPWRAPVTPETCCVRCSHRREFHCHKSKTLTGVRVDGTLYACQHSPRACASTSCAQAVGPEENRSFCSCPRFVSPYARRRQKKTITTTKERKRMSLFEPEELERMHTDYLQTQAAQQQQPITRAKTKAECLLVAVADFPDATVAELAEAAERSTSWVRRHLKAAGITLVKPVRRKKAGKP